MPVPEFNEIKAPVLEFFADGKKHKTSEIFKTLGEHMGTPVLYRDAKSGEREVALLKLNDMVFCATAYDALDVGCLGVHYPGRVRVAEFIRENFPEFLPSAIFHSHEQPSLVYWQTLSR